MPTYCIAWEIDIDAPTPRAAAERALEYMRAPDGSAAFMVKARDGSEPAELIDLTPELG